MTLPEGQVRQATAVLARKVVPVADPLEFARQRFELPVRGGSYVFNARTNRLTPLGDAAATEATPPELVEQARRYLQWCENIRQPGDCLQILQGRLVLGAHGRYAVAMAIAQGSTIEATKDSLKGMANPQAVFAMVVSGMTMYMMLWVLPEPVSKGIAAAMTVVLVAYLGVDTLYTLGRGWRRLVERADAATTFDQLRDAGEELGKVMGDNTARILVMLATAVVGSAANLSRVAPSLPGAAQASRMAVAEGGVALEAVGAVEAVTIAESGLTIALAPGALAMSSTPTTIAGTRAETLTVARAEKLPTIGPKIAQQMGPRGWTPEQIAEAIKSGERIPAINKATGNTAIRYVHPETGRSVVVDAVTNEVIHVGGPGFKYGPPSGDLP